MSKREIKYFLYCGFIGGLWKQTVEKKKSMSRIYWHKKSKTNYENSNETHCEYETERSIMKITKNEYYCLDQKKSYSSV